MYRCTSSLSVVKVVVVAIKHPSVSYADAVALNQASTANLAMIDQAASNVT
jgi:hypothetical protein